jgi:hypothetical protein
VRWFRAVRPTRSRARNAGTLSLLTGSFAGMGTLSDTTGGTLKAAGATYTIADRTRHGNESRHVRRLANLSTPRAAR